MNAKITFLFILISGSIFGQFGKVSGIIIDESSKQPIPFANVIIRGTTIGAAADFDGKFIIDNIPSGYHNLEISAVGFQRKISDDFLISPANPIELEINLTPNAAILKEVVVKSNPFNEREESPLSLQTIGVEEIERNPGGNRDISKVIQSFPGVASTPSFRNDIIIRGGAPNENRFYLDGIEVPNINHFATQGSSGGPVGIINVNLIREVDLFTGAFPANRGNALSSVLEFKQKDGNTKKAKYRGTLGSSDIGFTVDGPIGKKTTYIASVRRSYLQFLFSILELPFLPTYNDYQVKVKTKLNQKNEISFISLGAIDQFALNLNANQTEQQRYILRNIAVNEQWNYTAGFSYKHFSKTGFQTLVVSRNHLNNGAFKYENNDDSDPTKLILDYNSQEIENKARFETTNRWNGFKLNLGVQGELVEYTNDTYNRISIPDFSGGTRLDTLEFNSELNFLKYGAFGQLSKRFFESRLLLSAGFRFDGADYSITMNNPFNQFSPRISASYSLSEKWSLNFNSGIFYQLPTYTILGYQENEAFVNKFNNVKYLRSDHLVGGLAYMPSEYSRITVEGFLKKYSNYPVSISRNINLANLGADFGVVGNEAVNSNGAGRAYGLEVMAQQKLSSSIYGVFAYTMVRSEFKTGTSDYIPSAWDNKHIITITGGKKFKNNWEVGAKWRYVHGRPFTPYLLDESALRRNWDINNAGIFDFTKLNSQRLGAFHQLDIRVDKSYYLENITLNLYVDIQNVYNFKAEEVPFINIVEDETNSPIIVDSTLPYNQQKYVTKLVSNTAGTFLPSIGVVLDF